jgi:hypothetical protein
MRKISVLEQICMTIQVHALLTSLFEMKNESSYKAPEERIFTLSSIESAQIVSTCEQSITRVEFIKSMNAGIRSRLIQSIDSVLPISQLKLHDFNHKYILCMYSVHFHSGLISLATLETHSSALALLMPSSIFPDSSLLT